MLCAGFSLWWLLLFGAQALGTQAAAGGLQSTASVAVARGHGPCCSVACGIFPDQGSNPCPLQCKADSQQRDHQGSPSQSTE